MDTYKLWRVGVAHQYSHMVVARTPVAAMDKALEAHNKMYVRDLTREDVVSVTLENDSILIALMYSASNC